MIRCIAITFSALTLRIYLGPTFALSLPYDQANPSVAWLCWVRNLLIAEWRLRLAAGVPVSPITSNSA